MPDIFVYIYKKMNKRTVTLFSTLFRYFLNLDNRISRERERAREKRRKKISFEFDAFLVSPQFSKKRENYGSISLDSQRGDGLPRSV